MFVLNSLSINVYDMNLEVIILLYISSYKLRPKKPRSIVMAPVMFSAMLLFK